jgi:hypothetical protein
MGWRAPSVRAFPRQEAAAGAEILPDGKLVLSLRGHAHEELAHDAEVILDEAGFVVPTAAP